MTTGRLPSVEGGIQPTIVDAKGDLITATGADTPARLAVGATNGHILTVDSTASTGLAWAAPAGGSYTLIATASPSAASTFEFTSIPGTYKQLFLVGNLRPSADGNGQSYLEFNADTGSNYYYTASGSSGAASLAPFASSSNQVHNNLDNGKDFSIYQSYRNYTATTPKIIESAILGWQYDNAAQINTTYIQRLYSYTGTSAISSIKFYAVTGTYTGTVSLYGQN